MADDWRPGDLALCVKPRHPLRGGACYTVEAIFIGRSGTPDAGQIGLVLSGIRLPCSTNSAYHWRFCKLRPLTDEEREQALRDLKLPAREPAQ